MSVCSSSDLPEPVVPATRPCGPSALTSTVNSPSRGLADHGLRRAAALRPSPARPPARAAGRGRARRAAGDDDGSVDDEVLGADVPDRGQRPAEPLEPRVRHEVRRARRRPAARRRPITVACALGPGRTTAWHSSGSWRSCSSRHRNSTPTAGPSRSSVTSPGSSRMRRAPSSTTSTGRTASTVATLANARARRVRPPRRRSTRSSSSATRRAVVSSSLPTDDERPGVAARVRQPAHPAPGVGRRPARRAARRDTSAGECGRRRPARPSTPATRRRSSSLPGDAGDADARERHRDRARRRRSSAGPARGPRGRGRAATPRSATSAVPTRASIQSGSVRRRSHSRDRGPVANSSTVAGSGSSRRRAALSVVERGVRLLPRRGRCARANVRTASTCCAAARLPRDEHAVGHRHQPATAP